MALNGNLTGSAQYFNDADFYAGVATQSLKLDNSASSLLTRTPSAGDRKTWTWSAWIKRGDTGRDQDFFTAEGSGAQLYAIMITSGDQIQIYGAVPAVLLLTNQVLRDTSAWYHIAIASDTTQGTATDRLKLYLNGSEVTSFATDNRASYAQDTDYGINSNVKHNIGSNQAGGNFGDYYIAEVNFVDGTAYDASYFGETKNGVWIPKKYTGSYGTQGFRLEFKQTGDGSSTASSSTIGADTSGNGNHYKDTNLDAYDSNMPDSPENNFCTINSISSGAGTFSEGNLKYVSTTDTGDGTLGISSGKFYAEVYVNSNSNSYIGVHDIRNLSPTRGGSWSSHGAIAYKQNGDQYSLPIGGSSSTASYGASYTSADIIGIAADIDSNTVTFYKNGSSQGNTTNGISHISSGGVYSVIIYGSNSTFTVNFGQDSSFLGVKTAQGNKDDNDIGDFYYAPPSGYLALCTANLPEPIIGSNSATQSDDYFNTVTYTGNGSTQSITGVGHKADWVWIKSRSNGSHHHEVYDSSRGATKRLRPSGTYAEGTVSDALTSFDTDGFSLGGHVAVNDSGATYVAWNWKANGGTTVTNEDGSIDSTVQANTTAGFSIVTYTGNATNNATIGHGLGVKPDMIIFKNRDSTAGWVTYHKFLGATKLLYLDLTNSATTSDAHVNNTEPTDTLITLHDHVISNAADAYVAYCFHSVEGYSRFGKYTGNGNANGPFVFTGFRPSFILIKRTDTAEDWWIYDNKRDTFNPNTQIIYANDDNAEITGTGDNISNDFVSNGIKLRTANVNWNASGGTYIYMAFAEAPFKYANAR